MYGIICLVKSPITKIQKRCDTLLQALVKAISPVCESCGGKCQVGHHWIEKSRSANLRYNLENLIPLCNSCHAKIHNVFGNSVVGGLNIAEAIIKKRGKAWKERMDREGRKIVKVNVAFYEEAEERLKIELSRYPQFN